MTFWGISDIFSSKHTTSIINIIKQKKSTIKPLKSVTPAQILTKDNICKEEINEIRAFLKEYFGKPPDSPILDIPESELLKETDYLLYVSSTNDSKIIGTIRYHYAGIFNPQNSSIPMYIVDCFCIHPEWRKKGVGSYLLSELHKLSHKLNIPQCLFLKEGPPVLTIFKSPKYSSNYLYKELSNTGQHIHNINTKEIITQEITTQEAYRIMDIFTEFNPNIFIIRNVKSKNQHWRFYKNGKDKVLACFQDCYQYKDGHKMALCTAFITTPTFSKKMKMDVINEMVETISNKFKYVWMNKAWFPNHIADSSWIEDGSFHWYLYQWNTSMKISESYCIMI